MVFRVMHSANRCSYLAKHGHIYTTNAHKLVISICLLIGIMSLIFILKKGY